MEDNTLLNGIVQEAQAEAERILLQAEEQVKQRKASLTDQLKRQEDESERKIAQHRELQERRTLSLINTEERRILLRARESLTRRVIREARKQLEAAIEGPEYREILVRWIAEGALGVNREEAVVRCSFREKLDESILRDAEALVEKHTGRKVALSLSDEAPLSEQGVEISSPDQRVSFNNQVSTRLRRYDQDVKRIISEAMNI